MKKVLIISLIIILFVACGLFGYLYYSSNKELKDTKNELTIKTKELKESENKKNAANTIDCKKEMIGSTYNSTEEKDFAFKFNSENEVDMVSNNSSTGYEYSIVNNVVVIKKDSTPIKYGEISEDCNTLKLYGSADKEEIYNKNN